MELPCVMSRCEKNFFRDQILEEVQEKFEKLMNAEREAFLEIGADEENEGNGY
jgi:hypothetical protein